jgi:signal transduction histidine kinase
MKNKFNVGIVAGILALCSMISLFYGASVYKSETERSIDLVDARSKEFSVVFNELVKARFRAMGIAADTLLQSKVTIEPFAKRDRAALGARVDPYFAYLKKKHGVEQLNFWIPNATMFYRAGDPELGQFDGSKFRKSIVAAMERKDRIMTVETGQGGVIGIRAIVPVVFEDEFKGLIEYVSSFRIPLEGAAQESEFKWAVGLSKERTIQVERPKNDASDAEMGDDVFIEYSDKSTQEILRKISFDSRGKDPQIVEKNDHVYFVKTIPVYNFSGVATITIAMVDDITHAYTSAFKKALFRGLAVFAVLAIALLFVYYKIDHFRAGILGSIGAEKRLLQERLAQGDAAIKKLNDMDLLKRQNFYSLMAAINKPLIAINGKLSEVMALIEPVNHSVEEKIKFIEHESQRLQAYVADFIQIEQLRQGSFEKVTQRLVVKEVIQNAMASEELSRFPLLNVKLDLPTELPMTEANAGLLEKAFGNLLRYATSIRAQGTLSISGAADGKGYMAIAITGSVMSGDLAPSQSLLDESNAFLNEIASGLSPSQRTEKLMGLFLSKMIFEYFGGSMVAATSGEPGFIVHLSEVI